jgi:hypothetical protein
MAFSVEVLRKARQTLADEPGMLDSATSVQILSAPARPFACP